VYFEPLQYAVFFGVLVALGVLEAVIPLGRDGGARRRRWPANAWLTFLNIMVMGAMPVGIVAAADFAMARGWGLLNQAVVPTLAGLAAGFVLRSLVAYAIHFAMHKVPLLWRIHRVHHTDLAMDVSTTVRFHPLEFVISMPVLLAMVVVFGLPPFALMVYELLDAAMAVFTHANVRLPERLERALQLVLVTPAMHRIHHSAWQPETDSNYGATVSWWDRLFGTYRVRPLREAADLRLGLEELRNRRADSLAWLLWMPFTDSAGAAPAARAAGKPAR
jgi:sterol desaturase/sphingolipid hydroxylase (fatty acid hydroxylase superfamily)